MLSAKSVGELGRKRNAQVGAIDDDAAEARAPHRGFEHPPHRLYFRKLRHPSLLTRRREDETSGTSFEHDVERRFRGPADAGESATVDEHLAQSLFAGLSPQRRPL